MPTSQYYISLVKILFKKASSKDKQRLARLLEHEASRIADYNHPVKDAKISLLIRTIGTE